MKFKSFFNPEFYTIYTGDPAAEEGRMEAVFNEIEPYSEIITIHEADPMDIMRVHDDSHIRYVQGEGLYSISAMAAGCAIEAAKNSFVAPTFAMVRPPGHHASSGSSWGFCFFNNIAIAIEHLKFNKLIDTAFILDFDMHFGDGTVNILGGREYVTILNPSSSSKNDYMDEIEDAVKNADQDIIAISAGFDNHVNDWGGLLYTSDYEKIGEMIRSNRKERVFAVLEGGYNHNVIGKNALALFKGLCGF